MSEEEARESVRKGLVAMQDPEEIGRRTKMYGGVALSLAVIVAMYFLVFAQSFSIRAAEAEVSGTVGSMKQHIESLKFEEIQLPKADGLKERVRSQLKVEVEEALKNKTVPETAEGTTPFTNETNEMNTYGEESRTTSTARTGE